MPTNEEYGKKTSFWQLLENYSIKIPSIQRDYAQGRSDSTSTKIRDVFLKVLYNALLKKDLDEDNELKLDFIYGSIQNDVVEPLDGQQRLTTLWLLHWFVAKRANSPKEQLNVLKKFSYEIRSSSERFCNRLVDYSYPSNLDGQNLSDCIKNEAWFFASWAKDPTIQSMLTMLDSIQIIFSNTKDDRFTEYWTCLTNNSPIVFYFLSLDKLSSPDELYIKMNARGRQLTVFENLKAKLISKSDKEGWEKDKEYRERIDYKFDVDWTKIFWKYRNKTDENKPLIDDRLLNFLMVSKIIDYGEKNTIYESEDDDISMRKKLDADNEKRRKKNSSVNAESIRNGRINERVQLIHGNPQELDACDFCDLPSVNRFFELYENESFRNRKPDITLFDHSIEKTLFETAIASDDKILSFREAALFYAQSLYFEYLQSSQNGDTQFENWMRVMRNIVSAAWIEDSDSFRSSIKFIKQMAKLCLNHNDVYSNMSILNLDDISFAKEETRFESLKAKIIVNANFDVSVIRSLYSLEDAPYFKASNNYKGNLKFILCNCMDVSEDHLENYTASKAEIINSFVRAHIDFSGFKDQFRAAMLLYDPFCYGENFSVSHNLGGLPKFRFFTSVDDFKKKFEVASSSFEALIKDILVSPNHKIEDILSNATNMSGWNNLNSWKRQIVLNPNLLTEHCSSHHFSTSSDDSYCLLYGDKKRPEHIEDCYRVD